MNNLIPFFTAGFPALDKTKELIYLFDSYKYSYIEVGLAHSDALADGTTIQQSSQKALENGINIEYLLNELKNTKTQNSKLILFTYFNPVVVYGIERTLQKLQEANVPCILIPDLPIEEAQELLEISGKYNIKPIFLVTPTSTEERIKKIVDVSEEFVYLVSVTGITGASEISQYYSTLERVIKNIKSQKPELKVMIGFGIDSKKRAAEIMNLGADGFIIGSAIVKKIEEDFQKNNQKNECLKKFLESFTV